MIKKCIMIFTIIQIISFINIKASYSIDTNTSELLQSHQEEFEISDFIKSAQEYSGEFFEDIDINNIMQNAIKGEIDNTTIFNKILNLLGKNFLESIKGIASILVIILIHSLLKSISESLENDNIANLIYYVQYILIVTIILTNFSEIIKMVQDTCTNLVGFMNLLVPLLVSLMLYTGSITTSSVIEPIILFMINFIGNLIQTLIIPLVLIFASLIILSKLTDKIQIDKLSKFLKSGIIWVLSITLTIFVGIISLEGTLSSSVDRNYSKNYKGNCKFSYTYSWKGIRRCS